MPSVAAALGVGVALFVGFSAVSYWRVSGHVLTGRLVIITVMAFALALAAPLPPVWALLVARGPARLALLEDESAPRPER